ncbi:hypothetical protein AC249_AIPGENE7488 [Exaiptasia diaphana]|nr:hypothetical protein AC249_AIPGENE7488 [Exaiptasia diaphana]
MTSLRILLVVVVCIVTVKASIRQGSHNGGRLQKSREKHVKKLIQELTQLAIEEEGKTIEGYQDSENPEKRSCRNLFKGGRCQLLRWFDARSKQDQLKIDSS